MPTSRFLDGLDKNAIAWGSLVASLLVLGLKYLAWRVTGSIALLSDAIETIMNVVAAITGLWALTVASRPPDENHTYGHHKAEYLSAVAEGVMVIITALVIGREAFEAWRAPRLPDAPWHGIAFNLAGGVINLLWAVIVIRAGRRQRSPALSAAGAHILSDVWTSLALLAGVALMPITHWARLDAVLSSVVALNVLRVGYGMVKASVSGLMDAAPDVATQSEIRSIIATSARGAIEAHDLRVRIVGAMAFIEFHLVVPGTMSVEESHGICDRIEAALRRDIGNALIHIHVEPDRKAKHRGVIVLA
ncbi:cation efflux system protein [Ameyamaea chiangmaiensis NBRC 103196]|uniref:Cation transporter n=1 Tax=Ameyamaea chiangmaiensis TaxID=442969 RepID=A0A850P752_9PROT|nr:cation diffusion facilitator family transporter [Ameyamaea chiangmaiensis]MBS4074063.1 cation transporter [Ameyamaea chiangmaiensis]NVN40437.1 cation transporter [Ameyamaea chiangmaiensis]GBQ67387.1 cation efflux system protein [Ameyamaea chiangmaiensis NBRC 103196]